MQHITKVQTLPSMTADCFCRTYSQILRQLPGHSSSMHEPSKHTNILLFYRAIEENLQEMSQYTSSIAATGSVFDGSTAEHASMAVLGVDEPFPKSIVEHFYTRKRKKGLWPLEVFHHQIKMKFLGLSYWNRIRPDALEECELLPSKFPNMHVFATAVKIAVEGVKDLKSSLVYDTEPEVADVVETDGIFMHRPRRSKMKKRSSGSKLKKNILMSLGSDSVEDIEISSEDRFVTPEVVISHRSHFSAGTGSRAASPSCLSSSSQDGTLGGAGAGTSASHSSGASSPRDSPVHFRMAAKSPSLQSLEGELPAPPGANPSLTARLSSVMTHLRGLRILVIEDSLFQRKLMAKKLNAVRPKQSTTPDSSRDDGCSVAGSTGVADRFDRPPLAPPSPSSNTSSPTHGHLVRSTPHRGGFFGFGHPELSPAADGSINIKGDAWNVTDVSTGEEAIRLIINNKEGFDVIFVDENMQSSGGYLLGHEVRINVCTNSVIMSHL
jgi:CheY-like chemotaxis protein